VAGPVGDGQNDDMPHLLFEIWEDPEHHSFEMSMVTEHGDQLRKQIAPASVLRHSFQAQSAFEAYQTKNDWHGFGQWKAEPDWADQYFTEEDVAAQDRYLAVRNGS